MKKEYVRSIENIMQKNDGKITRKEAIANKIPSVSFSRYVYQNELIRIAPGVYMKKCSIIDELFCLQERYPKIIYSGITALYLHNLTDRIPDIIEFTMPKGYRVRKKSIVEPIKAHIENNESICFFGNTTIETNFGNKVTAFSKEKSIVEIIRKRSDYDSETFIKAIKSFLKRKDKNMSFLFEYARLRKIEKKVFEILEIANYDN